MNKELILKELKSRIESELLSAESSMNSTKSLNSSADMKQEGKYDTRAIEAGYLAGAQQARVEELKQDLELIEDINSAPYLPTDNIGIGALVALELNDHIQNYFLCSTAGGTMLNIDGESVLVISVFSPIGNAMMNLSLGEGFELETPKGPREYLVKSIC